MDVDEKQEAVDFARAVYEMKVRGELIGRIAIGNVPVTEKMAARVQTGWSWPLILGRDGNGMDVTNLTIIAWLARRASGEPDLMWETFMASWDDTVVADEITSERVPVSSVSDEDADPQP